MIVGGVPLLLTAQGKKYATFDPNYMDSAFVLSNGNMTVSKSGSPVNWDQLYLNVTKSSGLWAIELWNHNAPDANNYSIVGMNSNRAWLHSAYPGASQYGVGLSWEIHGYNCYNGAYPTNHFHVAGSSGAIGLVVFDFTNKKLLGRSYAGTSLIAGTSCGGSSQMYPALGTYCVRSVVVDINTGQYAFNSSNESILAAYESANGVTINRGLWE